MKKTLVLSELRELILDEHAASPPKSPLPRTDLPDHNDEESFVIDDEDDDEDLSDPEMTSDIVSDDEGFLIPEAAPKKKGKKPTTKIQSVGKKEVKDAINRLFVAAGTPEMVRLVLDAKGPKLVLSDPDMWWELSDRLEIGTGRLDYYDEWLPKLTRQFVFKTADDAIERSIRRTVSWGDSPSRKEQKITKIYGGVINWFLNKASSANDVIGNLEKQLKSYPGAEKPSAPLGRIAFPAGRIGKKKPPLEQNTDLENKLQKAIDRHYDDNVPMDAASTISFKQLLSKDLYSDVIHEPAQDTVYRGIAVTRQWLAKMLKIKKLNDIPKKGKLKKGFNFKPRKGSASSWSTDRKIAMSFAREAAADTLSHDNICIIVVVANISDNPNMFLAGENGLYKLAKPSAYKKEKEATALGTIKASSIEWEIKYL